MLPRIVVQMSIVAVAVFCSVPVPAQVADHLQCFSVKDRSNPMVSEFLVTLEATKEPHLPFQSTTDCKIRSRPELFCLHVQKSQVVPPPSGGGPVTPFDPPSFTCYRVKGKCAPAQTPFSLGKEDQLRSGIVVIGSAKYVCAPTTIGRCDQTANACDGTCDNPGEVCSSQFFGACLCVPAPPPACNSSLDPQMCSQSVACPPDRFCKNAFGGCACFPRCSGSFPACSANDDCDPGEHCGNIGGGECACVPVPPVCGTLTQPQCGSGTCPTGTTCQADGPTACRCM